MKAFPRAVAQNWIGDIILARLPKSLVIAKSVKENSRREENEYELGQGSLILETL